MTPADGVAFLRASELFEHERDEVLEAILSQGRFEEYGPGDVVFRQGDKGDRLYIVQAGVLEILATPADGAEAQPVAYLGAGEVLGELALLTGSARSATARAPERAMLFTLTKDVFLDLMRELPGFSRNLCVVLAKRLEATTLKIPRSSAKQLQGNLRYFDLATVIQTLITAQQTGTLTVSQDGGRQKLAELLFFRGNVARAKFRHLGGDDAFFQLFQASLEGDFSFLGRELREDEFQKDVTQPAVSLLLEAVRLQDELAVLKQRLSDPARVYRQKAAQLAWEDADTAELAAAAWVRLRKGASLGDLQREIPRSSFAVYQTVAKLLDTGQIE
jgi:CRP-like cAMP-binding protein